MTATNLRTAIEAAVYSPDSVNQLSLAAFQDTFGAPNCAQWGQLFDYFGISKLGRLIALGEDKAQVGRLPRNGRPTALVVARSLGFETVGQRIA